MDGDPDGVIEYQERAVAFIDVLGFADFVKCSEGNSALRTKLGGLIGTNKLFEQFFRTFLDFADGAFFSDTFVLSMSDPESRFFYLVRETGYFCRLLLTQGFACRGAITVGLFYHRDRFVVGPALVDAYRLEQSVAVYPRVILDKAALAAWEHEFRIDECGGKVAHHHLKPLVKRDRDGQSFLDIFHPGWTEFIPVTDVIPSKHIVPKDNAGFLKQAWGHIESDLLANTDNLKVLAKYEWLASECRDRAAIHGVSLT